MRLNRIAGLSCVAALLAIGAAARGASDPGVKAREENQQGRIAQGIRSGELTPREARILEAKEARLHRLERRLKSDGTLSLADRARLQHRLDELSRDIYQQKHDAQAVPPAK